MESQTVRRVRGGDELEVGLVEDDEHVVGNAVQEGGQRVGADGRSGRVVGGADEHQAGAVGDRRSHRVEVVPAVSGQGHHDR